jgi:ubiquinone/menaquinone biosynthesis C-methylase UbiE
VNQEEANLAVRDLGCVTNIEVIKTFIDLNGANVIDAGCGSMTFTRQLSEGGANVTAIDPDPVQAKKNRDGDLIDGINFVECGAEKLPVEDSSIDGIFFAYSLHHVPRKLYQEVFHEIRRVLNDDGFLYVIEPIDCPLNQVMTLFHDEEIEREAAQRALRDLANPMFEKADVVKYNSWRQFESFDDFATQFTSKSFNTLYTEDDVRRKEVRELFERLGAPDYRFAAPKQVNYYQRKV